MSELYKNYLNSSPNHKVGMHYVIVINQKKFLYTYIRKNACSAFKNFFIGESEIDNKSYSDSLKFMHENHLYDPKSIKEIHKKIFVYRSPVARIVSLFNNKFVERNGYHDIFEDVFRKISIEPDQLSFFDFCYKYLPKINSEGFIDPHVIPQHWYLLPGKYDAAIEMSKLGEATSELFGKEISDKYFRKPVNATSKYAVIDMEGCGECGSLMLHENWKKKGVLPSLDS